MARDERERRPITFEEAGEMLDEVADTFPPELFDQLNGGVVLLPDIVRSADGDGLYTLGMYHNDPYGLGRYINIYYGSFLQVHGRDTLARQKRALHDLLRHELTHHIESLAGVRDLEVKDEKFLEKYRKNKPENGNK